MIRALLLIALATPAFATQDGWPALYDVVGVAQDDVLNIRSGPGAGYDIIGALPPDAENIEVVRPSDDLHWGQINLGEGSGWISLRYAVPQPGQWYGQFPEIRRCFGTEPFWSLEVDRPRIAFSAPDAPRMDGLISGRYGSASRRDRFVYRGTLVSPDADSLDATLAIRLASCSDGMSDREYGIDLDLLITDPDAQDGLYDATLLSGCCSIQPPVTSD